MQRFEIGRSVARFGVLRAHPVWIYLAVAAVVYALVGLALSELADQRVFRGGTINDLAEAEFTGPGWLSGWARYDARWYRSIAEDGYFFRGDAAQSSVAFFPLYPLLMRALSWAIGGDPAAWGVAVTFASGFGSIVLFWRWVSTRMAAGPARTAVAVLAVWPYALYLYGAVYADALFVFLVLAAFTCVEEDRIPAAAFFGALATGTRPVGIAVVVGLTARVIEQRGVLGAQLGEWTRRFRRTDVSILLSGAGLAAYALYLSHAFGDPMAFATAEAAPGWDQRPGPSVWLKAAWFKRFAHLPGGDMEYFAVITLHGVLAVLLVALVPLIVKRFGWGYGLYTLALLAIPILSSKDFQGLGRYALGAFPAFAVLGEVLAARPRARAAWLGVSFGLLCFFSVWYARGGYIA